jgi:hypothetical protein
MRRRITRSGTVPVASVVLVWAVPLLAGAPKEVAVRWEELAPLVQKREIETVLANGVHIRGRVEQVLPEALVVEVKRTSDPNLVPKGHTRVARELVSALTVRWKQGPARALLAIAGLYGLPLLFAASGVASAEELGTAGSLAVASAGAAIGYVMGSELDARWLWVRVYGHRRSAQRDRASNQ